MDPKRHALYMRHAQGPSRRNLWHLSDHKPLEDVLDDVLEDVFGLPPRPHIDGHDGPRAASRPMGTPETGMRTGGGNLDSGKYVFFATSVTKWNAQKLENEVCVTFSPELKSWGGQTQNNKTLKISVSTPQFQIKPKL